MLHKAHEVYATELSSSSGDWLGYPLWCPEPGYLGEAQIGDVGHLSEGRFHRFFNITTKDGEPKPPQFEALDFDINHVGVDERQGYPEAGMHASKKVTILKGKAGGGVAVPGLPATLEMGCEFESTHERGAILYLQEPATSKKVLPEALKDWKQYLAQNCTSWAPFIKDTYKITIPPNKLILVTGWVKTSRWEVAAFEHKQSSESLCFKAGLKYLEGRLSFSVEMDTGWDWDHASGPSTRLFGEESHAPANEHKARRSANRKKRTPTIKAPRRARDGKDVSAVETKARAGDDKPTDTMDTPRRARDKKKTPATERNVRTTDKDKHAAAADTKRSTSMKKLAPTVDTPRRTREEKRTPAAAKKASAIKDKKPVPAAVVPQHSDTDKLAITVQPPRRSKSKQDQCIFLNFLEVDTWRVVASRLRGGAGSSDEPSCDDIDDSDSPDSVSSETSYPDTAHFISSEPDSYETVESVSSDTDDDDDLLPCTSIRKYIRKCSDAEIAVADNNDLELLLGEDVVTDDPGMSPNVRVISLANLEDYLNDQEFLVDVDANKVGTLSLIGLVQHAQVRREKLRWHRLEEYIKIETPRRWSNFLFDVPILNVTGGETSQGRDGALAMQQGDTAEDLSEKVVLADGRSFQWLDILFGLKRNNGADADPSFSILNGGKHIVTCGTSDGVVLWDRHNGDYIRHFLPARESSAHATAFSPNETILDSLSIAAPEGAATHLPIVHGAKFVATYQDSAPVVWSIEGVKLATLQEGRGASFVVYSPTSNTIAAALPDEVAYMWTSDGALLHTMRYPGKATTLAYSPDGTSLLIAADASAYLWNCESRTQLVTFGGHTSTIRVARFSHEGNQVVTGSDDCTSRVWDASTGEEIFKMEHEAGVSAVDFSPDDRAVASGCFDGSIVVVSDSDDGWKSVFKTDTKRYSGAVYTLAYSHNGKFIASGDDEGRVKVWMAKDGKFMAEFWGHQKRVKSVVWTPDGRSVVSSSEDGTVHSWSVYDVRRFL